MTTHSKQLVYAGTYTHLDMKDSQPGRTDGIYIYEFDSSSGKLTLRSTVRDVINPSFLAVSKNRRYLYAVNELLEYSGSAGGGISAFAIDPETAHLSLINSQPTDGVYPCYVALDATEKWILVANYGGGNVAVLPAAENGQLSRVATLVQNQGHSINPERQEAPHAHSVILDASQQYALVADLGIDRILVFRFDAVSGRLLPHTSVAAAPGAGPRHLEFHPGGRYLYVTSELDSTVSAYAWDSSHGTLAHLQTISAVPADFVGITWLADIHITRSGRFLYASNRGHDSIAVFAVDEETGGLTLVETVSSGGQRPRNFALDLTDSYLLAANQDSDNLVTFRIDKTSGRLTQTAAVDSILSPVFVRFVNG